MTKDFFDELDKELEQGYPLNGESDIIKPLPRVELPKIEKLDNKQEEILEKTEKNEMEYNKEYIPLKQSLMTNFPETKFYLPTLRDGYTRVIPIGGNNETGAKNMDMFQYGEDILLVDCGVQFAEPDMLGANYSVPDISFLTKYKDKIRGLVITHAHLDHIGALKNILPALGMPTIYGTKLTIGLIKKGIEEFGLLNKATFVEVDAGSEKLYKLGNFEVEFFKLNHSVPDCAGVYIQTPNMKIVHTGDFKFDFAPEIDEPADLSRIGSIGRRGIHLLMSDSTGSIRKGFSKSEKEVGETLEKIVSNHTSGRLIIATFSSWISRVQQLINICHKYDKHIFLSGRSMVENMKIAKDLGYLKVKSNIIRKMTPKNTEGIPAHKQVIITTGSQGEEFSALTRMAEGKHASIEIIKGDTIVFSSSVVPGNERSVVGVINKLIKLGAKVITKDNDEVHTGGHAFQEEQKIMLKLINPKYFMPIYGDLYFRTLHKETATSTGFLEENVVMSANGDIADFSPSGNIFNSKIKAPIQEIIIDGHGVGIAGSHVIKAREKMMNSGVLVILYKVNSRTKEIDGPIRLESRGLVYLDEVRQIHRIIIKKAKMIYENTISDVPDIEEKELTKIIKNDLETFLLQKIDREPMIIPMVLTA